MDENCIAFPRFFQQEIELFPVLRVLPGHLLHGVHGPAERLRLLQFPLREGRRGRRGCQNVFAQCLPRRVQQKGGIHAAGKGDHRAAEAAQALQ